MKFIRSCILFITLVVAAIGSPMAAARSWSLDSIAAMGKFPRFCIGVYRWGNDFFNGYDTTYVAGTGYKFNAKVAAESWMDNYDFSLPNNKAITMYGAPSTSLGVHLSYLAVSVGYDVNVSKLFTGKEQARQRLRFGFSCMLFNVEAFWLSNNEGTTIRRFGVRNDSPGIRVPFNGVQNETWGIDGVYYFSHKRYSEAAAFGFSRIQRRSAGSFFAGISYTGQDVNFDFSELPPYMRNQLPSYWDKFEYSVNTRNYGLRLGYGHNWVLPKGWMLGISESPIMGLRSGKVTGIPREKSFSLYNRFKLACVWNHGQMFAGVQGRSDLALVTDLSTTFVADIFSVEAVFGYRFNLW